MARALDRDEDERDQRDAGDAVGLESVRARADRVAGVVARAVRNDARVPRVVFLDVEDDLHQVRADVGDLREDATRDPERRGAQRFADGEADEAGTRVVARNEEQDAQHHEQLDADEKHPDAHARLQRNRVDRIRHSPEPRERRARVRERVHADAEPCDTIAARDADKAEEQDDDDLHRREVPQHAEVEDHDDADEDLEQEDELALGHEVGLARLVNQLGDLEHRRVHRHVAQPPEDRHAEHQTEHADQKAAHQQRATVDAHERLGAEVGQHEVCFAATLRFGLRGHGGRRGVDGQRRAGGHRDNQQQEQNANPNDHCLPLKQSKHRIIPCSPRKSLTPIVAARRPDTSPQRHPAGQEDADPLFDRDVRI